MNALTKPATRLSRIMNDLLRPDALIDRDLFDITSGFFPARTGTNIPAVNIRETPKEFILDVAAPGFERNDFKIELENHSLTISAEREEKKEVEEKEEGYTRREYSYGSFSRCFALPENVKEGAIDAKYEKGVLTIIVPKEKETPGKAPKTIPVK